MQILTTEINSNCVQSQQFQSIESVFLVCSTGCGGWDEKSRLYTAQILHTITY